MLANILIKLDEGLLLAGHQAGHCDLSLLSQCCPFSLQGRHLRGDRVSLG